MQWKYRAIDKEEWHRWFAWYPVRADFNQWVWLEYIWRQEIVTPWDIEVLYTLDNPANYL